MGSKSRTVPLLMRSGSTRGELSGWCRYPIMTLVCCHDSRKSSALGTWSLKPSEIAEQYSWDSGVASNTGT